MGSQSSKNTLSDDPTKLRNDHIFPDTVVQRFSFYAVIACLALSIATFLWVATNAGKWNRNSLQPTAQLTAQMPMSQMPMSQTPHSLLVSPYNTHTPSVNDPSSTTLASFARPLQTLFSK